MHQQLQKASLLSFLCIRLSVSVVTSAPWSVAWQNTSVGPDGPWNALYIPVDESPWQDLTLLPSLTSTLLVAADACANQSAECPLPTPATLWTSSPAHTAYVWMDSPSWNMSTWDSDVIEPLRLQGDGMWIHETITLADPVTGNSEALYNAAVGVTSNAAVTYPGGAQYTMDVGMFSLIGSASNFSWTSTNGTSVSLERQLPTAYEEGIIPSNSYGLHMGSAYHNVSGSLVLGGYDRSRVLTDPIISSGMSYVVQLTDIGLGVASGGSAFLNLTSGSAKGLLQPSNSTGLDTKPNPGVPYLYLPQDTCDAIANHLPVTFNSDFGLYIWNTDDTAYKKILSSPSYLSFTFNSSSDNNTIYVPFSLLNLTLESPLVSSSTQYFPCSPYTPSDGKTYHLGRAFLQAAFLSQNWGTNTLWLAQAPGPDKPSVQVTTIGEGDTSLAAMINAPSWYETWSSTLEALPSSSNSTSSSSSSSTSSPSSSHGISGGAIAGIVIGVIAALAIAAAIAFVVLRRRRRRRDRTSVPSTADSTEMAQPGYADHPHEAGSKDIAEAPYTPVHEIDSAWKGDKAPAEVEGWFPLNELPGSTPEVRGDAKVL